MGWIGSQEKTKTTKLIHWALMVLSVDFKNRVYFYSCVYYSLASRGCTPYVLVLTVNFVPHIACYTALRVLWFHFLTSSQVRGMSNVWWKPSTCRGHVLRFRFSSFNLARRLLPHCTVLSVCVPLERITTEYLSYGISSGNLWTNTIKSTTGLSWRSMSFCSFRRVYYHEGH